MIAAVFAWVLWAWFGAPATLAVGLVALVITSDFVLYPFFRISYSLPPQTGIQCLVGERGVVVRELAPEGYVKVRGELWRARLEGPAAAPAGDAVVVHAAEGLTLHVQRARPEARPAGAP